MKEELARLKASNKNLDHKEAFKVAAGNVTSILLIFIVG
jgi:hypothetical protein